MNGQAGITNYLHIIGSGHLREFLYKYRNLYKYSQQGWEHQNKKTTACYHRHSQKGGEGANDEDKSQIYPVFRFLSRLWMWQTGKGDRYFNGKHANTN